MMFIRRLNDESGQDLVEYALLLGIITLACIMAIGQIGSKVTTLYESVKAILDQA